ncbi:MAG: NADH:flavin oxidoreductase [Proteobacteria bacterium]|nr:NADH:flavin oxidoreductase [Pseudomonadota bacterium]
MFQIFEETRTGNIVLKNRIVRSATWENRATEEGFVTDELIDFTVELARGDVGLIVIGISYVTEEGKITFGQTGIHRDECIPGLRKLTDEVHRQGGRVAIQLAHGGGKSRLFQPGKPLPAPSDIQGEFFGTAPSRAMNIDEIESVQRAFRRAALRAQEADFDALQLHAAHGYLLSQFLSPLCNRREDEYGGDLKGRAQFVIELIRGTREAVGPDFPILMKINGDDFVDNGLRAPGAAEMTALFERAGLNAVEISGGLFGSDRIPKELIRRSVRNPETSAFFLPQAQEFRKRVNIPIILVGGIRSVEMIEGLFSEEKVDYVAMSRPFIREPHLVRRWKYGDRSPSSCRTCGRCLLKAFRGDKVQCYRLKKPV